MAAMLKERINGFDFFFVLEMSFLIHVRTLHSLMIVNAEINISDDHINFIGHHMGCYTPGWNVL